MTGPRVLLDDVAATELCSEGVLAASASVAGQSDGTSAESWLMVGAPHHTVLSKAIGVEVLADLAEMADTEMLVIDADTTARSFQRELRWNAAYHRLAEGL